MIRILEFRNNSWVWPTSYRWRALHIAVAAIELFQSKFKRVLLDSHFLGKAARNFFVERPELIGRH